MTINIILLVNQIKQLNQDYQLSMNNQLKSLIKRAFSRNKVNNNNPRLTIFNNNLI